MLKFSVAKKIASPNNKFIDAKEFYCFGKSTTYGFNEVVCSTLEEAVPHILTGAVSPYLYKGGMRTAPNTTGAGNLVMLDIDSKEDIRQELFQAISNFNFQHILLPTQNNFKIVDGVQYFKYRLAIPVIGIETSSQYKAFIHWFVKAYNIPSVDSASWTDARFYAPTVPAVGTTFSDITITEDIRNNMFIALGIDVGEDGSIRIPEEHYPRDTTSGWLSYDPSMEQYAPVDDSVESMSNISGDEFTEVFDAPDNTIDDISMEAIKAIGDKASFGTIVANMPSNSRVFCRCPSSHLHTNPEDIRYAWILKTGSGDARVYCASDHCKSEHGEFRRIVLPSWESFIADPNYHKTITRLRQIVEQVKHNLLIQLANYVCKWKQVELEEFHEKIAYAEPILFGEIIDDNALHLLTLLTSKERGFNTYIFDVDLDGCMRGKLDVKTANLLGRGGWYTYLFNEGYADFAETVNDKVVYKKSIFKSVVDTVVSDIQFIELKTQTDRLKPSEQLNGKLQVDYSMIGREVFITTNSFDTPVIRRKAYLEKAGVYNDMSRYDAVVNSFTNHWSLPYGSVEFEGMAISDLPTLLILFNTLNMFTDGLTNQRHSSVVITAPAGIGKTSLIKNFAEAGLSNGDNHSADIFGYDGLYPQTIDDVKNKLWVTGDELSPNLMKSSMRTATLLANLTRLEVSVNVKGLVNSRFTAFGKVLWGARAWDAISMGDQATELRSRLLAITYEDEHFTNSDFIDLCQADVGDIDNIVQHRLISIYLYLKNLILGKDMTERITILNKFKSSFKEKYSGTISYEVSVDDDDVIEEVTKTTVKSDSERIAIAFFEALLQYRNRVVKNPIIGEGTIHFQKLGVTDGLELDIQARRIQFCEEIMYRSQESTGIGGLIAIPDVRSFSTRSIEAPLRSIGMSDKKVAWITHNLKKKGIYKYALSAQSLSYEKGIVVKCDSKDTSKVELVDGTKIVTSKYKFKVKLFRVADIEKLIEDE